MRLLALLLLAIGVVGAGPAFAEVVILRGSSAPPPVEPPSPPPPIVVTQREIVQVPVPVYYFPLVYVTTTNSIARHRQPARR